MDTFLYLGTMITDDTGCTKDYRLGKGFGVAIYYIPEENMEK